MTRRGAGGFTLIEMLVVLVLLSICVALVYPSMFRTRERFEGLIEESNLVRNRKREIFIKFIGEGLPQKNYSSVTIPDDSGR